MRTLAIAAAITIGSGTASADGRHTIYVEAGGKAGAYGVGYELAITDRLALGGSGSFVPLRGQQIATIVPYLHARIFGRGAHSMFAELGAELVHSRIPSPVIDWNGSSDTGGGGIASLGWQRDKRHFVVRAAASLVVGEGGAAPWAGFAIGYHP